MSSKIVQDSMIIPREYVKRIEPKLHNLSLILNFLGKRWNGIQKLLSFSEPCCALLSILEGADLKN
jgi:hypothetical protein